MKRLLFLLILAIIVTGGCSEGGTDDGGNTPPPATSAEKIEGIIYQPQKPSDNDIDAHWIANSSIDVFTPQERAKYTFKGETGDYRGEFAKQKSYTAIDCKYDGSYAMYNCKGYGIQNGYLRLQGEVKETQYYIKNGFDHSGNTLYGTSEDGETFTFKSVVGLLCIPIVGIETVKSVALSGNKGETIAGDFYLDTFAPTKLTIKRKANEIILDGGKSGILLSDNKPTYIYFWVLPATLSEGCSVDVTFTDDSQYKIEYSESITIKAGEVCTIATQSLIDPDLQFVGITHSGEVFLFPTFTNGENNIFGVANMGDGSSISFENFTSYNYTDKGKSHTITFKVKESNTISFESCNGISKIDLSNF